MKIEIDLSGNAKKRNVKLEKQLDLFAKYWILALKFIGGFISLVATIGGAWIMIKFFIDMFGWTAVLISIGVVLIIAISLWAADRTGALST